MRKAKEQVAAFTQQFDTLIDSGRNVDNGERIGLSISISSNMERSETRPADIKILSLPEKGCVGILKEKHIII